MKPYIFQLAESLSYKIESHRPNEYWVNAGYGYVFYKNESETLHFLMDNYFNK